MPSRQVIDLYGIIGIAFEGEVRSLRKTRILCKYFAIMALYPKHRGCPGITRTSQRPVPEIGISSVRW
jgi:hypothetical protein